MIIQVEIVRVGIQSIFDIINGKSSFFDEF